MNKYSAVILGDSFNNTLGLIRSLGEACIPQTLVLAGEMDRLHVSQSRYLVKEKVFRVDDISDCKPILKQIADGTHRQVILCTNDRAATFVDENEEDLCADFVTPMAGKHLGEYMNKMRQCELARECGFDVPVSVIYHKGNSFPTDISYPLLLKPLVSISGEKSDIHICKSREDVEAGLNAASHCSDFIVQEYVEKEYEINMLGISTDWGVFIPGGIKKIRHYPTIYSPCSFGEYLPITDFGFDIAVVQRFMDRVGYRGLFSVELLHKGNKNYFMEVNFRNDGLAYTATAAGINLPAIYMQFNGIPEDIKVRKTYMMDLSIDFCHVKDGNISYGKWFSDFCKTGCQLNFNRKDVAPTVNYYIDKLKHFIGR